MALEFLGSEHMYDGSEPASQWPAPVATFPKTEGGLEVPGSGRCLQQWLQKIEYQGMQKKGLQGEMAAYLSRMLKASTHAEKRQDSELCAPPDFLRHWREAESQDEKKYLACQAVSKHMEKGLCCLPGIAVWLYQLKLESRIEKVWIAREEAEEAALLAAARQAASRPPPAPEEESTAEWTPEQWAAWRQSQEESEVEPSRQPEQTMNGASSSSS